jgi:hypothetical protein
MNSQKFIISVSQRFDPKGKRSNEYHLVKKLNLPEFKREIYWTHRFTLSYTRRHNYLRITPNFVGVAVVLEFARAQLFETLCINRFKG